VFSLISIIILIEKVELVDNFISILDDPEGLKAPERDEIGVVLSNWDSYSIGCKIDKEIKEFSFSSVGVVRIVKYHCYIEERFFLKLVGVARIVKCHCFANPFDVEVEDACVAYLLIRLLSISYDPVGLKALKRDYGIGNGALVSSVLLRTQARTSAEIDDEGKERAMPEMEFRHRPLGAGYGRFRSFSSTGVKLSAKVTAQLKRLAVTCNQYAKLICDGKLRTGSNSSNLGIEVRHARVNTELGKPLAQKLMCKSVDIVLLLIKREVSSDFNIRVRMKGSSEMGPTGGRLTPWLNSFEVLEGVESRDFEVVQVLYRSAKMGCGGLCVFMVRSSYVYNLGVRFPLAQLHGVCWPRGFANRARSVVSHNSPCLKVYACMRVIRDRMAGICHLILVLNGSF
jgi:hypothetical protein